MKPDDNKKTVCSKRISLGLKEDGHILQISTLGEKYKNAKKNTQNI